MQTCLLSSVSVVLGAVARHFRQREKWAQEEEATAFNQLLDNEPSIKARTLEQDDGG